MWQYANLWPFRPEDPCPRIAEDFMPCGLLFGHAGACVPFVPGDYLPPSLLHPLDNSFPLLGTWRCPVCRQLANGFSSLDFVTAFRGDNVSWDRPSREWQVTFQPCRCEARVLDQQAG